MTIYFPTVTGGNCCKCRETDICGQNHLYVLCEGQCVPSGIGSIVKPCETGSYIAISWRGGQYYYRRDAATASAETAHVVVSTALSCPTYPAAEVEDWHHCFAGCCAGRSHLIISDAYFKSLFPGDANDPLHPTTNLCVRDSEGCCYCGHSYVVNPVSHTSGVTALAGTYCAGCDNTACPHCVLCHLDICLEPLQLFYNVGVSGILGFDLGIGGCFWHYLNGGETVRNVESSPCIWTKPFVDTYYQLAWTGSVWQVHAFRYYGFPSSTCKIEAKWTVSSNPCDPRGVAVWRPGDFASQTPFNGGPCPCDGGSPDEFMDGATCVVS